MAQKRPLVLAAGIHKEIAVGDTIPPSALGIGVVGSGSLFLADDGTWKTVSGGGGTSVSAWPDNPPIGSFQAIQDPAIPYGNAYGSIATTVGNGVAPVYVPIGTTDTLKDSYAFMQYTSNAATFAACGIGGYSSSTQAGQLKVGGSNGGYMFEAVLGVDTYVSGTALTVGTTQSSANFGAQDPANNCYVFGWDTTDTSASFIKLFSSDGTTMVSTASPMLVGTSPYFYCRLEVQPGGATVYATLIDLKTGTVHWNRQLISPTKYPAGSTKCNMGVWYSTASGTTALKLNIARINVVPYYTYGIQSNTTSIVSSAPAGSNQQVQFNNSATLAGAANVLIDNGDLTLAVNTAPVTPATDRIKLFGRRLAGRTFPAAVGPSSMDYVLQPSMWRQKIGRYTPGGNSATVPTVDGLNAFTAVGTATARTVATTNLFTRTRRLGYVSAATAAAFANLYQTTAQYTVGDGTGLGGFFMSWRFGVSDAAAVSGARMFVGMSSSVAAATNVEPNTLTNSIGLAQLSTDATQFYIVYGGSAAQTAIALGTAMPPMAGTGITNGIMYDFSLFSPENANGIVYYRLERVGTTTFVEGTLTPTVVGTQTPASTTLLAPRIWRTNNATALAVGLDIISFYIETDY